MFLHDAEATTRVHRATVHPTRLASRVQVLPGLEAEGRPFSGTSTIYSLVPDRPYSGDFENLRCCAGLGPSRGTNCCPSVGAVPCEMPRLLAHKTHYLLIPELVSWDIRNRFTKPGGKERSPPAADPARELSSKTCSSSRHLRMAGRPRSPPPSWHRHRAPGPPSRKPSSSPLYPACGPRRRTRPSEVLRDSRVIMCST